MGAPATLAEVGLEAQAALYPRHVLTGCETALLLFAAGFWGKNDGYWFAEAGLRATCIDHDRQLLAEMAAVYPADWEFFQDDVYTGAAAATGTWDVVSIDCPTGQFDECADLLPLWCRLARRAVVLGAGPEHALIVAPLGWAVTSVLRRSNYEGGVYWAVVEPA